MQGYDPRVDAAELIRRHGPEVAQEIIAEVMRDRGMGGGNEGRFAEYDVRSAQRGMTPADLADGLAGAPQTSLGDDADLGGVDASGRDWSRWKPGMPLPPTMPNGAVMADNQRRSEAAAVKEADAVKRNDAIEKNYGEQARGIAEAGDAGGVTDYNAVHTQAEQDRIDYRRKDEMLARHGNAAARGNLRATDSVGAEARKKFRAAAAQSGTSGMPSEAERWNNYRAQMMLAGSNRAKNQVNAWGMMNDPGVSEEQRKSLQYMLPGGQLAAGVDANNAASAAKMAQNAVTAFLTNNPGASPEQKEAMRQKMRDANPAAAGAQDIASNKADSPEAIAEMERLAGSHDTTWAGFSYENESALASALQKPPYNLPQPEAEALAYRYAQKRRWVSGTAPAGAQPQGAPPAGGAAPPTNWRPPSGGAGV